MDIHLDDDILADHSDVGCGKVVYKRFATVPESVGTKLKDCVVGVEVEGFADHDVEVAECEFSGRFGGNGDGAEVQLQERENGL